MIWADNDPTLSGRRVIGNPGRKLRLRRFGARRIEGNSVSGGDGLRAQRLGDYLFSSLPCESWRGLSALGVIWTAEGVRIMFLPWKTSRPVPDFRCFAAEKKLRRAMSDIVGILPCVIGKSDPRWLEFGLKQPRPDASGPRGAMGRTPAAESVGVDFRPIDQSSSSWQRGSLT